MPACYMAGMPTIEISDAAADLGVTHAMSTP